MIVFIIHYLIRYCGKPDRIILIEQTLQLTIENQVLKPRVQLFKKIIINSFFSSFNICLDVFI
jgi:hypothetical protein